MRFFDAHLHVIDPAFPLVPNDGYLPAAFTAGDYLAAAEPFGAVGGAVVSGSFQAFDQTYLRDALERLGPAFVGVTQLPPSVSDRTVRELDDAGVRAVRFNLRRGGSASLADMTGLAARLFDLVGWHAEVYVDGGDLADIEGTLAALPRVVVDHLGLRASGRPSLLRLVERGAKVKATGFGRLDFDPAPFVQQIASISPNALLFGTDLPSTRAPRPFDRSDLQELIDALGPAASRRALLENAVALYRPRAMPDLSPTTAAS